MNFSFNRSATLGASGLGEHLLGMNTILRHYKQLKNTNDDLFQKFETGQKNKCEKQNIRDGLMKELEEILETNKAEYVYQKNEMSILEEEKKG